MAGISPWLHPLGFALLGGVALLMGVARHRRWWPRTRRQPAMPQALDTPVHGPPSIWHRGVLTAVEPASFTALCHAMFRQDGLRIDPLPAADAGVNARVSAGVGNPANTDASDTSADFMVDHGDGAPGRRAVRCQRGDTAPIDELMVHTFASTVATTRARAGVFITAGSFDAAAVAAARAHAITLVDGAALLKLIAQRSVRQQRALREIATCRVEQRPSRLALTPTPAPAWFAAAIAGFLAAWVSWPAAHVAVAWQADADASARWVATHPAVDRSEAVSPSPPRRPRSEPATIADLDPPTAPIATPAAGRQLLRCTDAGRVTYLAADATCAAGHGERITVFPTEGVNPLR